MIHHAKKISIHALLAESDEPTATRNDKNNIFLSTLSLRRATRRHSSNDRRPVHFYPRSPCGERLCAFWTALSRLSFLSTLSLRRATARRASRQQPAGISIHALLAESDSNESSEHTDNGNFYPRSPCGERPCTAETDITLIGFLSTLSLRRATPIFSEVNTRGRISIHALLAESDHICKTRSKRINRFLSTLSLRRATGGDV